MSDRPSVPAPARPLEALSVGLLFFLVGVVGLTYGSRQWLPALASQHGAGIDAMLKYLLVTVGLLFLAGHLALGVLIWQGSRRTRVTHRMAGRRAELGISVALGLTMAVIAEGGVLAIGIPVWNEYFLATPPADALTVEVTGQQFLWTVRYPGPDGRFGATNARLVDDASNPLGIDRTDQAAADDLVLVNQIYVPVDRTVRIRLRAKDVIHSFFLPHHRVKQDVIPGMSPEVVFVPTATGTYEIACTELCGLGHYRMQGFFTVLAPDEFERRLREEAAAGS